MLIRVVEEWMIRVSRSSEDPAVMELNLKLALVYGKQFVDMSTPARRTLWIISSLKTGLAGRHWLEGFLSLNEENRFRKVQCVNPGREQN
jgi:hypothetical protein